MRSRFVPRYLLFLRLKALEFLLNLCQPAFLRCDHRKQLLSDMRKSPFIALPLYLECSQGRIEDPSEYLRDGIVALARII